MPGIPLLQICASVSSEQTHGGLRSKFVRKTIHTVNERKTCSMLRSNGHRDIGGKQKICASVDPWIFNSTEEKLSPTRPRRGPKGYYCTCLVRRSVADDRCMDVVCGNSFTTTALHAQMVDANINNVLGVSKGKNGLHWCAAYCRSGTTTNIVIATTSTPTTTPT